MRKPNALILDELMDLNKNGLPKGDKVGFEGLDKLITFGKGGCTDVTGYPFYGKSLVLKEILVSLTVNHNWRHAIYMPDDGIDKMILSNFIHKVTGKRVEPNYPNSMTANEVSKIYLSICDSFVFWGGGIAEPKQFWDFAKSEKCDSAVIDSWNYMAHAGDPTRPDYLRQILAYRNIFMDNNKMHSFIIIHPKNPDPLQVKDGNVKKPTVYNIMGGSEWNNNGRNILVVHKNDKMDYSLPYDISTDKIKPKHLGEVGFCSLHLDWNEQRYYERIQDGYETKKVFAYGSPPEIVKDPMHESLFEVKDNEPF